MKLSHILIYAAVAILWALPSQNLVAQEAETQHKNCVLWPQVLEDMPTGKGGFVLASGQEIEFNFRMANTSQRSTHGFQFTCAETIESTNIMFYFKQSVIPSFHMNNVVAPLDIAFIDKAGKITDILLMKTYSVLALNKPLYSPSKPVLYALEARAGYFSSLGIQVGDHVEIDNSVN